MDYPTEGESITHKEFAEGVVNGLRIPNGVLISEVVARKLSFHLGDELTVRIRQDAGRIDTAELIVGGIFPRSQHFGCYNLHGSAKVENASSWETRLLTKVTSWVPGRLS